MTTYHHQVYTNNTVILHEITLRFSFRKADLQKFPLLGLYNLHVSVQTVHTSRYFRLFTHQGMAAFSLHSTM